MSDSAWRETNPHFRVDHDSSYTFADIERWKANTRVSRESFFSNPEARTTATMDDIYDRIVGYSSEIEDLLSKPCGITIDRMFKDAGGVVVRIFQHPQRAGMHLVYRDPSIVYLPPWLNKPLNEWVWDEVGTVKEAILGLREPHNAGERLRSTPEEMGDIKPVTLPEGYKQVSSAAVKPSVDLDHEGHKAAMRALFLREQRAKTILAELQAAEALSNLYCCDGEPEADQASATADLLRESARTWA